MKSEVRPTNDLSAEPPAAASPQGIVDRRELALMAVERCQVPLVVTNPREADNPIVLANRAFLDLTGYDAEEVVGRNCRFLQGAETSQTTVDELRAAVAAGSEIRVELCNYRKDGSTFWNQLHASPVRDAKGRLVFYLGSQLDVTERRLAQSLKAAEHRLLREVDHRAMNALALVDGIVRLSAASDPKRYAASIQGRVHAIGRAHSALAASGWTSVLLEDLLRAELGPSGTAHVSLSGPSIKVVAVQVQPLALVFHEMFSNATQHGALSTIDGFLNVEWEADVEQGRMRLSWRETGGPASPEKRPKGFGATMIKAIVERQLGGKVRNVWASDGLKAQLELPMAA